MGAMNGQKEIRVKVLFVVVDTNDHCKKKKF